LGVGYIFSTKEVFFTKDGVILSRVPLPKKMKNKLLYPALSLASRDHHRVHINLGMREFKFDVQGFLQKEYFQKIFKEINSIPIRSENKESLSENKQKINLTLQFHDMVRDYLSYNCFTDTL
jgi:hypothetical protein